VTRIQALPSELLKTTYHCLNSLDSHTHSEFFQLRNEAIGDLNRLASAPPLPHQQSRDVHLEATQKSSQGNPSLQSNSLLDPLPTASLAPPPKLILMTSFVFPSHVITAHDRQVSILLQQTLQTNLNNPLLDKIVLVNQIEYNFTKLTNSHKIQQLLLHRRVRYSDLFRIANEQRHTDLVIFAACDIVFDSTLHSLHKKSFWENQIKYPPQQHEQHGEGINTSPPLLALTSWSTLSSDSNILSLSVQIDKQDVWILRPPIDSQVLSLADFTIGSRKADHRLARIFFDAGYR
jgi:hypothetical protein